MTASPSLVLVDGDIGKQGTGSFSRAVGRDEARLHKVPLTEQHSGSSVRVRRFSKKSR